MSQSTSPRSDLTQAEQACSSCKMRKRKCTKGLPKCALCTKKNWDCDYSQLSPDASGTAASWQFASLVRETGHSVQSLDFSTIYFLDPQVLHQSRIQTPENAVRISPHVSSLLGDTGDTLNLVVHFFDTIHVWLPIVSKKRFFELEYHLPSSRPELQLLLLCMKLVTSVLPEHLSNPRTSVYYMAKQLHLEMELAGILTIQVLQASILISMYELGHAIYPSAYLSIGACARYAYALGMNRGALSAMSQPFTWVEQEERRRLWWAIIVLDRFASIGCAGRRFAIEDPKPHDLLPIDDATWDLGLTPPDDVRTVTSPSSSHMSKFGLVAQAAWLLGQVLRHVSSKQHDHPLHDEDGVRLDCTLRALIKASELVETAHCEAIGICYSALITLHDPDNFATGRFATNPEYYHRKRSTVAEISKTVATESARNEHKVTENLEGTAPWGLHLIYQASVSYIRINRESPTPDSIKALAILRQTMATMGLRWKAAGAYLKLLEGREVSGIFD